jgi:hypothetical protein
VSDTQILNTANYELLAFIDACKELGYKNNDSLESMRYEWCKKSGGTWFATYDDKKIVGVSGVHPWIDGVRALFRGAQLYSIPGGLSKFHMNCWMFRYHLPLVIDMYKDKPIYITTNTETDASGKMLKLNKLYFYLEKWGMVEHNGEQEIMGVMQNVWKLNKQRYLEVREREIYFERNQPIASFIMV